MGSKRKGMPFSIDGTRSGLLLSQIELYNSVYNTYVSHGLEDIEPEYTETVLSISGTPKNAITLLAKNKAMDNILMYKLTNQNKPEFLSDKIINYGVLGISPNKKGGACLAMNILDSLGKYSVSRFYIMAVKEPNKTCNHVVEYIDGGWYLRYDRVKEIS